MQFLSLLHACFTGTFSTRLKHGNVKVRMNESLQWSLGSSGQSDEHLGKRMVESLAFAIESVPDMERDWGIEASDARQGLDWIRTKRPDLWKEYGQRLESAATRVGWGTYYGHDD